MVLLKKAGRSFCLEVIHINKIKRRKKAKETEKMGHQAPFRFILPTAPAQPVPLWLSLGQLAQHFSPREKQLSLSPAAGDFIIL